MSSKHIGILIAASALGGCNTWQSHYGDEAASLGEAVKYDAAVQTINPAPVYSAEGAQPGDNGAKGAAAVKRYRTDAVKPLETMQTSSGSGSSSSGGPH